MNVTYENNTQFCSFCTNIGHNIAMCRKRHDNHSQHRPQHRGRMPDENHFNSVRNNDREREDRDSDMGEAVRNMAINTIQQNNYNKEINEVEAQRK